MSKIDEEYNKYSKLSDEIIDNKSPIIGLFIKLVINTGLNHKTLSKFSWDDLKNKKYGNNAINDNELSKSIEKVYNMVSPTYDYQKFLLSKKKLVFTPQRINIILKSINEHLTINYLRKIFCKAFLEKNKNSGIDSLVKLQSLLGHSSTDVTARFIDKEEKKHRIADGCCYIIKDDMYPGWYKIGRALNEIVREGTLLHHAPMLEMVKIVKTHDYVSLEQKIHKDLEQYRAPARKNGKMPEWFKLSDKKLEEVIKKYNFIDYE